VKQHEAKLTAKKNEEMPLWQKADKLMTSASSIKVRYQGLLNAGLNEEKHKHLPKAVTPLRNRGEEMFNECMQLLEECSPEEQELFWISQERNRGVTSFDQLVTKKDFVEALRLASTSVAQGNFEEEEEEEETSIQQELSECPEPIIDQVVVSEILPETNQIPNETDQTDVNVQG